MVIDTDGSAFITKAEFDSLKNNFQAQIDSYNSAIDSKIDGAIASYLSGIQVATEVPQVIPWSGGQVSFCDPENLLVPEDQFNLDYLYYTPNATSKKTSFVAAPAIVYGGDTRFRVDASSVVNPLSDSIWVNDYLEYSGAEPTNNYVSELGAYIANMPGCSGGKWQTLDQEKVRSVLEKNIICGVWYSTKKNNRMVVVGQTSIYTAPISAFLYLVSTGRYNGTVKTANLYDYKTGKIRRMAFGLVHAGNNIGKLVTTNSSWSYDFELDAGLVRWYFYHNDPHTLISGTGTNQTPWPAGKLVTQTESTRAGGSYDFPNTELYRLSPFPDRVIPAGQLIAEMTPTQSGNCNIKTHSNAYSAVRYDDPRFQIIFTENKLWCKGTSNASNYVMSCYDKDNGWQISNVEELPANNTDCGTQVYYKRGSVTEDAWSTDNPDRPADGALMLEFPTYKVSAKDEEKYSIKDLYCELYSSDTMSQYGKSLIDGAAICKVSGGQDDATLQFTISSDTNTEILFNIGAFNGMNDMGNISVKCGDTAYDCSTETIPLTAGASKTFIINHVNPEEIYFAKPTSACTLSITNAVVLMDK